MAKKYDLTPENESMLRKNFVYHSPHSDQPERYGEIRGSALGFALEILSRCPESRERSLALTRLEESVMWANAAIARNEEAPKTDEKPECADD